MTLPTLLQSIRNRGRWWLAAALVLATCIAYSRLPTCRFVSYDDPDYVTQNSMVANGLTWEGVRRAFTEAHAANYHPLTWISHMVDVEVYGLHPAGHHITNLLFHLANTLLLFALLAAMTGTLARSGLVAALFALHPSHVESVAWIAERKDVLSVCLALLTIAAYVAYVRRPNARRYLAVTALFALALLAKPMVVTLPLLLLLLDLWPLGRTRPFALLALEKLPLLALSATSSVATLLAHRAGGAVVTRVAIPLGPRLDNAAVSCLRYLGKLLWPSHLALFYPHPYLQGRGDWPPWLVAIALTCLAVVTLLALRLRHREPALLTGWLWFLIALLPVIGIVQVGKQAMADRYTYLPSVGIFIAAVWGGGNLAQRIRAPRPLLATTTLLILALLGAATWQQTGVWHDSVSLYRHSLTTTRDNWEVRNNLGNALLSAKQPAAAIEQYRPALEEGRFVLTHDPQAAATLQYNYGVAEQQLRHLAAAARHYRAALAAKPNHIGALNNLGTIQLLTHRYDEAAATLERLLHLDPDHTTALFNLGETYRKLGRWRRAIDAYQRFLARRPDYGVARLRLAQCQERLGEAQRTTTPPTPDR